MTLGDPARRCSPSTFWVTILEVLVAAGCERERPVSAFGSACATDSRREAYQRQTSAGSAEIPLQRRARPDRTAPKGRSAHRERSAHRFRPTCRRRSGQRFGARPERARAQLRSARVARYAVCGMRRSITRNQSGGINASTTIAGYPAGNGLSAKKSGTTCQRLPRSCSHDAGCEPANQERTARRGRGAGAGFRRGRCRLRQRR